ncbi:8-amino-7-oxononanoate synthase [Paenibacillus xylaniclasticus]|uniref:8-amino-7-oxononanoate synthase n=1 Tax=Paenibacillus xylaniclasticus TaxID=588083 RepID=UPI000FD7F58D|nr:MULTISPECIES: 8-amino-7-oxononanoate synthase [Paenibacillus]GFN32096.1 putative 8-amino-7-oxononanoate synthase [Paenibacillus curdlanolyticus]
MQWMEQPLAELNSQSLLRTIHPSSSIGGTAGRIVRDRRELLDLSSNDYLGLSQHTAIKEAMIHSLQEEGCGAGSSRLINGNREGYAQLEEALAQWLGADTAVVFGSGYMCNIGTIAALAGRGDAVFSDRLNHASIVDGIQLSRAEHIRYRHNDMDHLESLLKKHEGARRKWIVTDAIFSMDGDAALLRELVELKHRYNAGLIVDEAHSGGMYGAEGQGLAAELGLSEHIDVHIGTFSKSFGVYGAYAAGTSTLRRWLINKARPLIYSTALPPSVIAGARQALKLIRHDREQADKVRQLALSFRETLSRAGLTVIGRSDCPIVPVITGDPETAVRFRDELLQEGIAASAIRTPTVPADAARVRFSLSSAHTRQELQQAAAAIIGIAGRIGLG